MNEYVLVVVDMQPFFTRNPRLIARVKAEVERARQLGLPIVLLEIPYHRTEPEKPYAPTYASIMKLVAGYEKAHVVTKLGESGGLKVIRLCEQYGYPQTRFRVCGVKTDLCVLKTVKSLLARTRAFIDVPKQACDTIARLRKFCWAKFPEDKRLRLIDEAS